MPKANHEISQKKQVEQIKEYQKDKVKNKYLSYYIKWNIQKIQQCSFFHEIINNNKKFKKVSILNLSYSENNNTKTLNVINTLKVAYVILSKF